MAGNFAQSQGEVKKAKCGLLNHILWHIDQGEQIWDRLVNEQLACTEIIAQQVIVNDKFSEYHDLWMDRNVPDDILTFHRFNEIDEEVTALANQLEDFEPKSLKAIDTIKKLLQTFSDNRKYMDEMREYVIKCTELNQLESANLDDFDWINEDLIPNILELEGEWNELNLFQRINVLVGQMRQLNNAGEHYSSDGSSSSSAAEALAIIDDY